MKDGQEKNPADGKIPAANLIVSCKMQIPEDIKRKSVSLSYLGINEVAWKQNDALKLLKYLEKASIFVLGGDVLSPDGDKYTHNYDNWYFEEKEGNFKDSIAKAKDYIYSYPKGNYLFVIVI